MHNRQKYRVATAAIFLLAASGLLSCAGPQPLDKAINPKDESSYSVLVAGAGTNPGDAYLRAKAAAQGVTFESARQSDAAISATDNPFSARHDQATVSRGAVIYSHECAACHGVNADGRGPTLPVPLPASDFHRAALRMDMTFHGGPVKKWFTTIQDGTVAHVPGPDNAEISIEMPAFKERLSREQTWLVITYLQSFDADIPASTTEAAR